MYPLKDERHRIDEIADHWSRGDTLFTFDEARNRLFQGYWAAEFHEVAADGDAVADRETTLWTLHYLGFLLDLSDPEPDPKDQLEETDWPDKFPGSVINTLPRLRSKWTPELLDNAYREMATATADEYPEAGRAIVGAIELSRATFGRWCDSMGYPRPAFWFRDSAQAAEQIGSKDGLNQNARRKGGKRPKYNRALQEAISRLRQQIGDDREKMTLPTLKDWFWQNASYEERFSFEPPIPNCDELYIDDGEKLVWTDRDGRERSLGMRSLERYIHRVNNPEKV